MSEIRAASLSEITPGAPRVVESNGTRLMLVRVGEQVHALGDVCTHQGGPLSDGKVSGAKITCPWHGWQFDARTGQCLFPPRGGAVPRYPVRIDGNDVWVDVP